MSMDTRLRAGEAIDPDAWDAFVAASPQGSLYARHWYLSIIAPGWQAIDVWENGERVALFPLPRATKYGLVYSLQPPFAQTLGPMFRPPAAEASSYKRLSHELACQQAILAALPPGLILHGFQSSPALACALPWAQAGYELLKRYNFYLPPAGQDPAASYAPRVREKLRSLRKAGELSVRTTTDSAEWSTILGQLSAERAATGWQLSSAKQALLRQLMDEGVRRGMAYGVLVEEDGGHALACALFFQTTDRVVNLQPMTRGKHPAGLLQLHAGIEAAHAAGKTFDFEGSMLPGVSEFYRRFGARPEPYLYIRQRDFSPRTFIRSLWSP